MRYSSIYKVMVVCYNYYTKHTQRIVNYNIFIKIVPMKVKKMTDVFSIQDFKFPTNFLWGSAVAGHQVEGNNIHSNNWYNERQTLKANPSYEVSGMACNHYNMYREDVLLLKELGHQAFRLSIEWARIEPEEGRFLQTELDHYINELAFLKENGIRTRIRHKPSEGSEEILDSLRAGYVSYVINTRAILSGKHFGDGVAIRQCAAQNNIAMLTSLDTVRMVLDVLEEVTLGISTIDAR